MSELLRVGLPLAEGPRLVAWCNVTNMLAVSPIAQPSVRPQLGGAPAGEQSDRRVPTTAIVLLVDPSLPSDVFEVQVPLAGGTMQTSHGMQPGVD